MSASWSSTSFFVPRRSAGWPGVSGNHPLPVHLQHALHELLGLERVDVDEAAAGKGADRDGVDDEDQLLLRQAHHQVAVGVVEAHVVQLEHGAAELEGAALFEGLVGQRRGRILDLLEALLGALVRDDLRAGVLERLAAGDVVVVVVAVDQVLDRLVGDLLDLLDVGHRRFRPPVGDRVGGDHAVLGDHEHRLVAAVAEDVDAVGAFDLGGLVQRALLRLDGEAQTAARTKSRELLHG